MKHKYNGDSGHKNKLVHEKSPYLLQHAENPVDWYPWGQEAFDRAKKEDKPVFLSIGYSTCHWCHVMAHESFEDQEIATMMNDAFISVKVDREERPDIDDVYMSVCQAMTGSGGWPLTIIMTSEGKPFFAATYIPKETRFGLTGMRELIPHIEELWRTKRGEVDTYVGEFLSALRESSLRPPSGDIPASTIQFAYEDLAYIFDEVHGGFGSAPKFPTPHNLLFLLRYWKRTRTGKPLKMVERTLQAMRLGGIYDHIGFGFHRYSTDDKWLVPHFEKMLYDQALLALGYVEAYQATENTEYSRTADEIFTFVLREMTSHEGGFYTALDADSEGEEGKFYLWSQDEIESVLTEEDTELACKVFNIRMGGNFTDEGTRKRIGKNILHMERTVPEIASELRIPTEPLRDRIESIRQQLYECRETRVHPRRDDKILTDWNGLMIASLAKGARVLDKPAYAEAAGRAVDFILETMRDDEEMLLHRYREKEAAVPALLDDYALLIWGLLELYETTFEVRYLESALDFLEHSLRHFWDAKDGGFFSTADYAESLILRRKESYDGALPSGNSAMMMNLVFLGHLVGRPTYLDVASRIGRVFSKAVDLSPATHTHLLSALDLALGPSYETVICGDSRAGETRQMIAVLNKRYLPHNVIIFRPAEQENHDINAIAPFTKHKKCIDGRPTAYVCQNHSCRTPTTDIDEMFWMLGGEGPQ